MEKNDNIWTDIDINSVTKYQYEYDSYNQIARPEVVWKRLIY